MIFNKPNIQTKVVLYSLSPRLEKLIRLLKYILIVSAVIAIVLPVILMGYYSDTNMKMVISGAIVTLNMGLLLGLAYPSHSKPARQPMQRTAEILFVIICINLSLLLASLWGDFAYSNLLLRYCAMLNVSILAFMAPISILEAHHYPWLPSRLKWLKYATAGCLAASLLMMLPIINSYVGRDIMEILFASMPPLPRMYFNAMNLLLYASAGGSLYLVYLKQQYQKKST